ncbi:hypothetical protein CTAYLR_005408 [Chrysophaeum taylorii]|uniref:Protein kinase domain-containing protein n=1 Tax=Chrysophaeum taylorii TaxID=2483200 RepID=A0AAD7U7E4_9STRA|nr:hypothetical protein CTAYLR_005408 [Chrysophaeum taylorii]
MWNLAGSAEGVSSSFGSAVAVSDTYVLVGGAEAVSVYSWSWEVVFTITRDDAVEFGRALAVAGSLIVVGAPGSVGNLRSGKIYTYEGQTQLGSRSRRGSYDFGWSLAASDSYVVAGASDRCHVFDHSLSQVRIVETGAKAAVAINADILAIAFDSYLWRYDVASWLGTETRNYDEEDYGRAVAISPTNIVAVASATTVSTTAGSTISVAGATSLAMDGDWLAIGANDVVYATSSDDGTLEATLASRGDTAVAIRGDYVALGGEGWAGAYERTTPSPTATLPPTTTPTTAVESSFSSFSSKKSSAGNDDDGVIIVTALACAVVVLVCCWGLLCVVLRRRKADGEQQLPLAVRPFEARRVELVDVIDDHLAERAAAAAAECLELVARLEHKVEDVATAGIRVRGYLERNPNPEPEPLEAMAAALRRFDTPCWLYELWFEEDHSLAVADAAFGGPPLRYPLYEAMQREKASHPFEDRRENEQTLRALAAEAGVSEEEVRAQIERCPLVVALEVRVESMFELPFARGGFSQVHRAKLGAFDVAVKRFQIASLQPSQRAKLLRDFKRELKIMIRLDSPLVVRVYGVTTDAAYVGLVLEYMPGGTLRRRLDDPLDIPSLRRFRWSAEIAGGMHYLYARGVEHRDLKSSNVLLAADDGAKVADFGLSRSVDQTATGTTSAAGTAAFMAPEWFEERFTEKADVYSYAITLYEIVSRARPWPSLTPVEIARAVVQRNERPDIKPLSEGGPDLAPLVALLQRCWAQHPDDRPSFADINAHLDMWLG